jgi:predicted AAA+ superfamily ATPase
LRPHCFFWRDQQQKEIDLILDEAVPVGIEIKSGKTVSTDYFTNLQYWKEVVQDPVKLKVIYGGELFQDRSEIQVLPWSKMDEAWS